MIACFCCTDLQFAFLRVLMFPFMVQICTSLFDTEDFLPLIKSEKRFVILREQSVQMCCRRNNLKLIFIVAAQHLRSESQGRVNGVMAVMVSPWIIQEAPCTADGSELSSPLAAAALDSCQTHPCSASHPPSVFLRSLFEELYNCTPFSKANNRVTSS